MFAPILKKKKMSMRAKITYVGLASQAVVKMGLGRTRLSWCCGENGGKPMVEISADSKKKNKNGGLEKQTRWAPKAVSHPCKSIQMCRHLLFHPL